MLKGYSLLCIHELFLNGTRRLSGMPGLNLAWLHASQAPYPLYYLSLRPHILFYDYSYGNFLEKFLSFYVCSLEYLGSFVTISKPVLIYCKRIYT